MTAARARTPAPDGLRDRARTPDGPRGPSGAGCLHLADLEGVQYELRRAVVPDLAQPDPRLTA
ncbi:hypothetical protein, partial [Streptomyces niveus]|uniref:hypothetical protein n=1 Tax=Streptomyces niveus TaxID=193462 RepID=UPI001C3FF2DA